MPAGQDLINFDFASEWELIVNTSRNAETRGENSHFPIEPFDLGVSLYTDYIAVVAGTTEGRDTWFLAGDITQVYPFAKGAGNPVLGKIKPTRTRLVINRLQVVETNRISLDNFRLEYAPPRWFKQCTIKVYKYVGKVENFVEDTLLDIGNAVGADPNTPEARLDKRLDRLEQLIIDKFTVLCDKVEALEGGGSNDAGGNGIPLQANGQFQPRQPEDNITQAYFQGFL